MFTLTRTRLVPNIIPYKSPNLIRKMASQPAAKITSLDHLVLTVSSIPATQKWYEQNLGMKSESFVSAATPSITRHSLLFGQQKINLHQLGKEFEPKAQNVKEGSADLCFLTSGPVSAVRERLIENGVQMVDLGSEKSDDWVVERTGARGKLRSVYCRDLDGNLVEISNYV
ncbi:Glyoxalase/Bleomycin resistance protein/Dihydroxybiphenyl dioxygenase [Hyaloscypha variabilis]